MFYFGVYKLICSAVLVEEIWQLLPSNMRSAAAASAFKKPKLHDPPTRKRVGVANRNNEPILAVGDELIRYRNFWKGVEGSSVIKPGTVVRVDAKHKLTDKVSMLKTNKNY